MLLESRGLVKNNRYRRDRLVPFWVAHLAAHLGGQSLTTRIISKAGSVTLLPLDALHAQRCWSALLEAWQHGATRPLPLALHSAFAWLDKGGNPASGSAGEAYEAARARFEDHEPQFNTFGERDSNAYLARAFANFEALWAGGEFAHWAQVLLKPLSEAVGKAPPKAAKATAAEAE